MESTAGNPYLAQLLKGSANFDALANQRWFLHRIAEFINDANSGNPLILDQDPTAIVKVYSRMFRDNGLIDAGGYGKLLAELGEVEETLTRWRTPRTIFFLDAPAEVLYDRVFRRSGNAATPPLEWFATVRSYFLELSAQLSHVISVATADIAPPEICRRVVEVLGSK